MAKADTGEKVTKQVELVGSDQAGWNALARAALEFQHREPAPAQPCAFDVFGWPEKHD